MGNVSVECFLAPKGEWRCDRGSIIHFLFNDSHVGLFDENWASEVAGVVVNKQLGRGASGIFL